MQCVLKIKQYIVDIIIVSSQLELLDCSKLQLTSQQQIGDLSTNHSILVEITVCTQQGVLFIVHTKFCNYHMLQFSMKCLVSVLYSVVFLTQIIHHCKQLKVSVQYIYTINWDVLITKDLISAHAYMISAKYILDQIKPGLQH